MAILGALAGVGSTMLQGIRAVGSTLTLLPFRIQFSLIWFFAVLFLLFNAEALYGDKAGQQVIVYLLYMTSLAFVFSLGAQRNPLVGVSAAEFLITFGLWLAMGIVLLKIVLPFTPAEQHPLTSETIGLILTHALVVAVGEELLFRHAIPSLIPGPRMAAQTISAFLFGALHWVAYDGNVGTMLVAVVLGLFFGAIVARYRNGIIVSIALHAAWNFVVLGLA